MSNIARGLRPIASLLVAGLVCAVTTPLRILYWGLQTTARGLNLTREAISSGRKAHYANNEKIKYLQKMC